MNSRQINFFLNEQDQIELNDLFSNDGELIFCKSRSEQAKPKILDSSVIKKMGGEPLKILLVRKADLDLLKFRYLKIRNEFVIDTIDSPVVEYSRCFLCDEFIRRGRMYFLKSFYDDAENMVTKNDCFLSWADALLNTTKAELIRSANGDFLGKGARWDKMTGKKMKSL